ncbi:intermediate filament protein domain-containing protein [Purpureocillium lavendulum]|uniref:Intermediate filament protein domain-containing protein n=1 Tax=Purpureocillium lavendulum TaxID=1247861 RepID=A0AB34FLK3_9HYPO|nr:intermediate filament protein domain-containing protein [Purpureocillium lavendulum]
MPNFRTVMSAGTIHREARLGDLEAPYGHNGFSHKGSPLEAGTTAKVGAQQSSPAAPPPLPKVDIPDLSRMSRRWYFETTPAGKEQFVSIKRSRSHHHRHYHHKDPLGGHHHHHHHGDHDTYRVSRDEWNRLVERERCLEETNKSLVAEVAALKASLSAAQAEAHHLCHVVVPQLQGQVNVLAADNEALRRSLDSAGNSSAKHCHELDRLKQTIAALEKEKCTLADDNACLRDKVKSLARQLEQACGRRVADLLADVRYWKDQVHHWKCQFEETRRRHDDTCGMLEIRTEKMRAYEEILRRRRII